MFKSNIIITSLKRTYQVLPAFLRKKALFSIFLLFINSILEVAGLASILPLLMVILKNNIIQENEFLKYIYNIFHFNSENTFIVFIASVVVFIIVLKNIFSLLISRYQVAFSFSIMEVFLLKLHQLYNQKGFLFFKKHNTNFIFRDIFSIPLRFAGSLIIGLLNLLNEFLILILIVVGIIFYSPGALLILCLTMLPVFLISYKLTKNKIKHIGEEVNRIAPELNKNVIQSIFAYADIMISGTYHFFYKKIKNNIKLFADLSTQRTVFNLAPTKIIESSMVLSILIIIAYGLFFLPNKDNLVSLIGIYTLAAYRIMPSINRITVALNGITENQYNFDVIEQLKNEEVNFLNAHQEEINFNNEISIENISFKYPEAKENVLTNYNLKIRKGETIGIIGKSGRGKTTLMNILLGFLSPDKGVVKIDDKILNKKNNRNWQKKLGYVQQEVYLLDASLAENIAFGLNEKEIDYTKLDEVIKSAGLQELLKELPYGLKSRVGERGSQLSGGQRQRIGIARALYFDAEVLFFDEATSSLDTETETQITKSIEQLAGRGLTMIIIAHRESTLKNADRIIKL